MIIPLTLLAICVGAFLVLIGDFVVEGVMLKRPPGTIADGALVVIVATVIGMGALLAITGLK